LYFEIREIYDIKIVNFIYKKIYTFLVIINTLHYVNILDTLYKLKLNIIRDIFINRLMLICWTINVVCYTVCYCYLFNKRERNPKGQSRDTVNIRHTWHRKDEDKKITTHQSKKMSNTESHHQTGDEPRCSWSASRSCFLKDTALLVLCMHSQPT
jgi:hypothetical protein